MSDVTLSAYVLTAFCDGTFTSSEWPTAQQTYGMPCLPNGVCDYIDGKTKIYWRNTSIILFDGDGGESWTASTDGTLCKTFYIENALTNSTMAASDTQTMLTNRFVQLASGAGDVEYARCSTTNTILVVNILKSRIGSPYGVTEFKAWLAANNLIVQYQRTATDHPLTTSFTSRIQAIATDYASITGALNPLTASVLSTRYTRYVDASAIGELLSLPDGKKDTAECYVEDDPQSANFQLRMFDKIATAKKITTPSSGVSDGWVLCNPNTPTLVETAWTDGNADGLADGWTKDGTPTCTVADGKQTITLSEDGIEGIYKSVSLTNGHIYYAKFTLSGLTGTGVTINFSDGASTQQVLIAQKTADGTHSALATLGQSSTSST